jgi:hypothetical protein
LQLFFLEKTHNHHIQYKRVPLILSLKSAGELELELFDSLCSPYNNQKPDNLTSVKERKIRLVRQLYKLGKIWGIQVVTEQVC